MLVKEFLLVLNINTRPKYSKVRFRFGANNTYTF